MRKLITITVVILVFLTGCQAEGASGAVATVENYYQAMVGRNDEQFASYTCAEWEEQALLEYDSFQGVKIAMDGFSCRETGTEGEFTLVQCAGKIAATYGNEQMDFPLDDRVHRLRNEGGDWRVCGY